jgi:putative transposase
VPHLRRAELNARHPLHVTMRVLKGLPSLRGRAAARGLERAFRGGRERFGFRLIHYSIQRNRLHLLVEAADRAALSRGMQGLAIRCARALNRALAHRGKVFVDRYHSHVLATRREVARALKYVLENATRHGLQVSRDHCSSAEWLGREPDDNASVSGARTRLLRIGWRGA